MRNIIYLVIGFLAVTPTHSALAGKIDYKVSNIIEAVRADWNKDLATDLAVLIVSKEREIDFLIYLSVENPSGGFERKLVLRIKNIVWTQWITHPATSLSLNKKKSIVLESQNYGIGRLHWTKKVIIAYRGKRFIIAGYVYTSHDTRLDESKSCSVNYLSGKGTYSNNRKFNKRIISLKGKALPLSKLNLAKIEKDCDNKTYVEYKKNIE